MKLAALLSRSASLALAVLGLATLPTAHSAPPIRTLPPIYPIDGGVQMSLNTSAYRVVAGDSLPVYPQGRKKGVMPIRSRESFAAAVMLANRSGSDLTFTFPDADSASRHFRFRVYNAANEQVWESAAEPVVATDTVTPPAIAAVLRARSRWSASVLVPLKKDGIWLPAGVYTLEASIAGTPSIGATALFEIATPPVVDPPPIPPNTGILGKVTTLPGIYVKLDGSSVAPDVLPWGTKSSIVIQEIVSPDSPVVRSPFTWRGETADDGTFRVPTPVGRFRVQATALGGGEPRTLSTESVVIMRPIPYPISNRSTVETTVTQGTFSTVSLFLGGGVTYEPPHEDTGITGQVFLPATSGSTTRTPAAGVWVTVEQIVPYLTLNSSSLVPNTFGFRWTGTTDQDGKFRVNTPPGSFRITARSGLGPLIMTTHSATGTLIPVDPLPNVLTGSAMTTVADGSFSDVAITLAPRIIYQPATLIYSVTGVEVQQLATLVAPAQLHVSARGMASTSGWSSPTLRVRDVTADGFLELEFVATAPGGVSLQVLTPISAETNVVMPPNFKGVRVFAASNSTEALVL